METSYLKLYAKKRLVKNCFRCFCISIFPFVTIFSLSLLNYYLFMLLRQTNFSFNTYISQYAEAFRVCLMAITIILSVFLWKISCLFKERFFFYRVVKSTRIRVPFHMYLTYFFVSVLKFLLSVSWGAVFFSPCVAVALLLRYSYRYESYGYNVNLTLFVASIILLAIGGMFFFITLKRYSCCSYVLLTGKEKSPLKIIAKSIEMTENHCGKYSRYCLSLLGWALSCIFVIPLFYAVPYINLSKWSYICNMNKKRAANEQEKPIIFFIQKRVER